MAQESPQPTEESGELVVGDVLRVSDLDTGFSEKPELRPCMITKIFGHNARVAGRSASGTQGVPVPKGTLSGFDQEGVFFRPGARISLALAKKCERLGLLPEPYKTQVLFYLNEDMP